MPIYHGGLLHANVRYFDPDAGRAGLPDSVAALVERVDAEGVDVTLINLDPHRPKLVLIQVGSFGEHQFTKVTLPTSSDTLDIDAPRLRVELAPAAGLRARLKMRRFAQSPTYARQS
jgi:hypothetical protein